MTKLSNVLDKMELDVLKARWKAGHKDALPAVLCYCLVLDRRLPKWARLAWLKVFKAAGKLKSETWDELLGALVEKGTHLKDHKLHTKLRHRIVCRIEESDDKVGKALFE